MKPNKYIRIVTEGEETEPTYFRGIIKSKRLHGVRIVKPRDNSPMGVVREAINEAKKGVSAQIPKKDIHVWAVFDRDRHPNLENAIQMAFDNDIYVGFSSVCFEYFIVLHYEKCTRPFASCDEIIRYIRNRLDKDYQKNKNQYLTLKDKIEDAVRNNEWLLETHWAYEDTNGVAKCKLNPYSDVYVLVKFLMEL